MVNDLLQFSLFLAILTALAVPLGLYLARVFRGQWTPLTPVLAPVERGLYAMAGVRPDQGQHWSRYALSLIAFNAAGFLLLYAILRLQHLLPLNPMEFGAMAPDLAFNTAVSFVTNTNWQAYGGETTLSPLSQMLGLTTQNFVSAATGMAVAVAVTRAVATRSGRTIGNFWVDLVRANLYVLLPICLVSAVFLVNQGMPQTLDASVAVTTLDGNDQTIALGPVASQVAIKMLGTNGGGFFNVNASHPFENPTALSNFVQILLILAIPAAFPFFFGRMVGDMRQGVAIWAAMTVLFVIVLLAAWGAERFGNPLLADLVEPAALSMEGKEVRFGLAQSVLFAVATTVASCGAVNTMHDSLTPLGGLVPLFNMLVGEVIYGGVGAGFYGAVLMVVLTVFLAGLMVGRTPEWLGKKVEAREVKLAALTLLVMPIGVLALVALAIVTGNAQTSAQDAGPHGLSEVIYAYTSGTANNGSAFAGFSANTVWHNTMIGLAMLIGRFGYIVPVLAIAGLLAAKKTTPASAGTFPTHGPVFVVLLISVIVVVGALTFLPALALGPIAEHVSMIAGITF
ncbi:potassium-transporting ATPase subunit KdpA [Blastochloris viridis]|uniref:Potassium-transporting ATPase potassium-binding subunit n=1 Tax=Blastochloris viridis TaxID=1079 RepID=A0A0H5BJ84_BLAVI|nr:potassium-transporting ATPase subunit KdpA [Blastochloris viridis]ALK09602.1 Potassium-transporting ATPase A chain [Blastochloris viridis]BAS00507.1 potassium-transporting ATPase A chain [Blastochloris viridis]CUU42265.1 potassium-transporting ATPase subunit A [Blastochloris viridis]